MSKKDSKKQIPSTLLQDFNNYHTKQDMQEFINVSNSTSYLHSTIALFQCYAEALLRKNNDPCPKTDKKHRQIILSLSKIT